jgi:hypothetical protein
LVTKIVKKNLPKRTKSEVTTAEEMVLEEGLEKVLERSKGEMMTTVALKRIKAEMVLEEVL